MRRILPYLFGLRALLVIVLIVAGMFGVSLRANADEPAPLPEPTAAVTSEPVPSATADDLPELVTGLSADDPQFVRVVLSDAQLDRVTEGTTAMVWALAVMVFCSLVTCICVARGTRS